MEDYKEKYEKALERAKDYHRGHTLDVPPQAAMEYVFPELKESEDERIRKELIEHIKANCESGFVLFQKFSPDNVITWLEKQGEQSPAWSEEDEEMFDILIANYGFFCKKHRNEEHDFFMGISLAKDDLEMINWLKSLKERVKGE